MEFSFDSVMSVVGLLIGGSGLGGFCVWKWQRRKAKAEAQTVEVNMAKEVQDIYQQALKDKDDEMEDKNRIITELRQDRDHFRQDRNELRDRLDKMEEKVRDLQHDVARNGRVVEAMRPFMCADLGCKLRKRVVLSADGEVKQETKKSKKKES